MTQLITSRPAAVPPVDFTGWATPYVFFTGKGGVGKTTTASASAVALADAGRRVLLVSTDPASNLGDVLGVSVGSVPTPVPDVAGLDVMDIDPEVAAQQYRERVVGPYRGVLPDTTVATMEEQLAGACTVEIAAFDEFTALLADHDVTSAYDHIVFDTAPTGHTLRLLSLPTAWTGFLQNSPSGASCLGPLAGLEAQQARYAAAVDALADPVRTTVALVARAEVSALAEATRAGAELADIGIANQQLVVNGVLAGDAQGDLIAGALLDRQAHALATGPDSLSEMPTVSVPLVASDLTGLPALRALANTNGASAPAQADAAELVASTHETLGRLVDDLARSGHGAVMTMGKGGVGKTTVAAALAVALADRGLPVTLSTTDPAAHLTQTLAGDAPAGLEIARIDPAAETARYRDEVLAAAGDLDDESLALLEEDLRSPCTEEIAVFGAFARTMAGAVDRIVVLDTAPTGHTLLLLDAAQSYHKQVERTVGEVPDEVRALLPRLRDPEFAKVVLVTHPESTPVFEASRLAADLERAGISPYGWVVNASFGASGTRHPLLLHRAALEQGHVADVAAQSSRTWVAGWQPEPPVGAAALRALMG